MSHTITRLQRDLRTFERQKQELNIPMTLGHDERDLRVMWVNMVPRSGPYAGQPIHMHITFGDQYPAEPPTVVMKTKGFVHPNVFDWGICLDMLKEPKHYAQPYSGWSAAYDLSGLLLQLYSFLLVDETIDQMGGYSVQRSSYNAAIKLPSTITCSCGFHVLPTQAQSRPQAVRQSASELPADASDGSMGAAELPQDLLEAIIAHTDDGTRAKLAAAPAASCDALSVLALQAKQRDELVCFFLKEPAAAGDVLGVGVHVEQGRGTRPNTLSMTTDLLSGRAFRQLGVRRSAWNLPFDAFLPLALNEEHARRALAALPAAVPTMLGPAPAGTPVATRVLELVARLMNSLVVEMMQHKPADGVRLARHMSDTALTAFCHLHHLLLSVVVHQHPQLVEACVRDVRAFVERPAARAKSACPDLGLLMIKLMLVPKGVVPWAVFAPVLLRELLARQVLWLVKDLGDDFGRPWALSAAQETDERRLTSHFEGARTSLRVIALTAGFANSMARPGTTAGALQELGAINAAYNRRNGDPPPAVFQSFNRHAHAVLSFSKWTEFLSTLKLSLRAPPVPADSPQFLPSLKHFMANMLRQAVLDSTNARYHNGAAWPRDLDAGYLTWAPLAPVAVFGEW